MSQESRDPLETLHELIDHCIRIRELAEKVGNDQMKQLIELLLLETGKRFSKEMRRAGGPESTH